jgi:hypothetical protein
MAGVSWLIVFATTILSGFPRLFYPFRGFWNRLNTLYLYEGVFMEITKEIIIENLAISLTKVS